MPFRFPQCPDVLAPISATHWYVLSVITGHLYNPRLVLFVFPRFAVLSKPLDYPCGWSLPGLSTSREIISYDFGSLTPIPIPRLVLDVYSTLISLLFSTMFVPSPFSSVIMLKVFWKTYVWIYSENSTINIIDVLISVF